MSYYIMQAVSSSNGQLYNWKSAVVDFAAAGYPGPGSPLNIAISSYNANDNINSPISYHDLTYNPVGLWQFNGTLNDSSGNNFTLSDDGTGVATTYTDIYPGVKGLRLISTMRLVQAATGTALQITGDMTIEMLLSLSAFGGGTTAGYLVSYGNNAGTNADNLLYSIRNLATSGLPSWIHESTGPATQTYSLSNHVLPLSLCHFAVTRTSNVIQFYLNGTAFGSASSALTAASGGTSSKLRVGFEGTNTAANTAAIGSLASLKIISSALSASQIKAEYNRTLGQAYGVIG